MTVTLNGPAVGQSSVSGGGIVGGPVGMRILSTKGGTIDNSTQGTFHIAAEVPLRDGFDAVQAIFVNYSEYKCAYVIGSASVWADGTDLNNSSGTWLSLNRSNDVGIIVPNCLKNGSASRPRLEVSDWLRLPSVARSDSGGVYPMLGIRAYPLVASATQDCWGSGYDVTNWANRADGYRFVARRQAGNHTGTATGFTTTTNLSQSVIAGFRVLPRGGRLYKVACCADSIGQGQGTYIGEGFVQPAVQSASLATGKAAMYSEASWAGQAMGYASLVGAGFFFRALDLIRNPVTRPDILVYPTFSPNDVTGTIAASDIAGFRVCVLRIVEECRKFGVKLLLYTGIPCNSAVRAWGATDALRVAFAAEMLGYSYPPGVVIVNTHAQASGAADGTGQIQIAAGLTSDGIHLNDAGNAVLSPVVDAGLRQLM